MALLGVYVGNSTQDLAQFENWLGRDVDGVHGVVGSANWDDFVQSAEWAADRLWSSTGRDVFWSVPLLAGDANLHSAANGDYNQYYRSVAEELLGAHSGSDPIYVRTGWEFNGDWFSWSAGGQESDFISAFREFVDTFRSVSDLFKFEWTPNESYGGWDPAKAYPGDDYVDIIGMDFYWKPEYQGSDPVGAWNELLNETYGLKWHQEFAAEHGKPTAYSEWGVTTDNARPFLEAAKEWFDSHDVVYHSVWDSDVLYPGKMSDGSGGDTNQAFKELFGSGSDGYAWTDGNTSSGDSGSSGDTADNGDTADQGDDSSPSWTDGNDSGSDSQQGGNELALSASAQHESWGTGATETWTGTDGNDQHQSNGGGDTMYGGAGDDTYIVSASNDMPVEKAGEGVDTVSTWISEYTLPDNVENLVFFGYGWSNGTGNGLNNIITGTSSQNVLDGRGGDDQLNGGAGPDTFVLGSGQGHDTITDFSASEGDKLLFRGFDDDAWLSHDGDVWTVTTADGSTTSFTLEHVTSLSGSDYSFA
ncbi:glycosyl hydrolase [Roseomonas sp. E05]|uniref:glycosyl hydrolase n=1 Tax=Roseomonas sp. E05 TaxID=3046310 RepID=UPI0024BB5B60|nr:glycosyl hydrolase [Roseomonas sp. E05]MDJ0391509.1 glycosyl hydrolase [Roseomonas sp. E05]